MKISYQNCGSSCLVFIKGDNKLEVEQRFYSFWNWKATNGELDWFSDTHAKFWSSKERMLKYFENICLMELIDNHPNDFKGKKAGAMPEARRRALERFEALEEEKFPVLFGSSIELHSFGVVSAERPDEDWRDLVTTQAFAPRD